MPDDKPEEKEPDWKSEVEALKAQLAAKNEREQVLEQTLKTLANRPVDTPREATRNDNYGPGYIPPETRARLKARLGAQWQDADIDTHWSTIGTFLSELAAPLVNGLGTVADRVDYLNVRAKRKDYAEEQDFAAEVEEEYQTRRQRGEARPREDLAEMIRARPKWRAKDVERETAAKLAEERGRSAEANAATTEGAVSGGQAKPGDNAFKSGRELSPDEFKALSMEDKESYLEGKTF